MQLKGHTAEATYDIVDLDGGNAHVVRSKSGRVTEVSIFRNRAAADRYVNFQRSMDREAYSNR